MATKKMTTKTADTKAASDLLREERRETRELKARLQDLELRSGVGMVNGVARKQVNGFVDFLREQSVVGLAIGLVFGTQVKQLVDTVVASFISPLLALILPGKEALEDKAFYVSAFGKTSQPFTWGKVLLALISFIAVAAIVYAIFKMLRLDKLAKKKDDPAKDKKTAKKAKK